MNKQLSCAAPPGGSKEQSQQEDQISRPDEFCPLQVLEEQFSVWIHLWIKARTPIMHLTCVFSRFD